MRKTIASLAFGLLLAAPGAAFAKDTQVTFAVSGWHCAGCSGKTETALKGVKGVKTVTASLDKKQVVVAFDDSQTNEKALKDAIKTAGFEASTAKN
jgi:mercuric transport protein